MESFDTHYAAIYQERWEGLKEALLKPTNPVAHSEGLLQPYYLDEGSLIVASLLPVTPGQTILDMCAAPGGKSLILAKALRGEGLLILNDRSSARRARLKRVVEEHLPPLLGEIVKITSHDGRKWGLYEQEIYDGILIDAPCSSERHLLQNPKLFKEWSPSRGKRLATDQFAFLAAALEAVKRGGYLLYSTCSINPLENEEVIAKLFKRRPSRVSEVPLKVDVAEKRAYGYAILPDRAQGMGPLYFALLRRED
ncbi:MAG: RsmB/NOP family class I SAM-dependent RNA methyltransferase [Spirochaetales bacterium]|jgi:16S rRNA C967 or C1407 C5-methylase (RsmB/RsmF family)|nr:RsmB/NOP family class I SAM-dependent RNA methyltransferase [Spirochaetales bacterium]